MAGDAAPGRGQNGAVPVVAAGLGVGLLALLAIWPTIMPGVGFWDIAEIQAAGPLMGTMHPTGFPALVVLGWLASVVLQPFGEPAFRMNLLSAILVGAAAAGTVGVARRLAAPTPIAAAAGLGLALTPIAWRIGTAADAHALHLALLVVLVAVLLAWERRVEAWRDAEAGGSATGPSPDRWLVGAAAVYGVMSANHSLTLLLAPAVGVYVLAVDATVLRRRRTVAAAFLALAGVAALLYLELPLRAGPFRAPLVYGHPETWDGFWYVVLAEQFRGSFDLTDLGGRLAALVVLAEAQFGVFAVLVPAGFVAAARVVPRYALLSGLATLVTCFFAASYQNADIGRYYLGPVLFAWTWLAILATVAAYAIAGAAPWRRDDPGRAGGPEAPGPGEHPGDADPEDERPWEGRLAIPAAMLAVALLVPTGIELRDRYVALDRSRDTAAATWMADAYAALEPDAVVISWWSYSTPLWYGQLVEGRRPDVRILDDRTLIDEQLGDITDVIESTLGSRPVYVIRATEAELAAIADRYELEQVAAGGLHRVVARRGDPT